VRANSELGFIWDKRCVPLVMQTHPVEKTCFRLYRLLPDLIREICVLEGEFVSRSDVTTALDADILLEMSPTLQSRLYGLDRGIKYLMAIVRTDRFAIDSAVLGAIHHVTTIDEPFANILTRDQAELFASKIWDAPAESMTGSNALGHVITPNDGASIYRSFQKIQNDSALPFEKAMALFLSCELRAPRSHEARATAMLMMNGVLLQAGIDAIGIPVSGAAEFQEKLTRFRSTKDGSEVVSFVLNCHPAASEIYDANPHLRAPEPLQLQRGAISA
jgi:hypothetical protein